MSNILVRTITGAFFISTILFPLFLWDKVATGVLGGFMILALIEFYQLFKKSDTINIRWEIGVFTGISIFGISIGVMYNMIPAESYLVVFPIIFLSIMTELWRKQENPLLNAGIIILGLLYVLAPFLLMIHFHHGTEDAQFSLLAGMFILIWMNDTFAYLSGRFFGKTKLIERISPNKTWEGTMGGILFTILAGVAIGFLFDSENQLFWIISAAIIAPCASIGDLLESIFKRNADVKDSGNLLPGHGGVLDRFDATLFTIPFFMLWTAIYTYL